jgi:ABC-type multidrug transport system ATPase subunit
LLINQDFLDEPTSGLGRHRNALMHLMRRLADQGRTIILITHATKNVMLADKVVFLARGGYLAWFGPPDEALKFFDQYRSERDRRTRSMEFDEIYAILDDSVKEGRIGLIATSCINTSNLWSMLCKPHEVTKVKSKPERKTTQSKAYARVRHAGSDTFCSKCKNPINDRIAGLDAFGAHPGGFT